MSEAKITPRNQWTNGGDEVLIVRFVGEDGKSYNGFQHPMNVGETVTAPDWNIRAECGGGIHGWPWAFGLGEGKDCDWQAVWQVYGVKPADIVDLAGKVKFRTGVLRFKGHWADAMNFVLYGQMTWVFHSARGSASNSGGSGSASNSGARGSASTTHEGTAAICTGLYGKAKAAKFGCIALSWWNEKQQRSEMRCAQVGGAGNLKPDVWYTLNEKTGKFVVVKP